MMRVGSAAVPAAVTTAATPAAWIHPAALLFDDLEDQQFDPQAIQP